MPLVELFSNSGPNSPRPNDVYVYDRIPERLRVQVINIIRNALGNKSSRYHFTYDPEHFYQAVHEAVAHEHGVLSLSEGDTHEGIIIRCLLSVKDVMIWLDIVVLSFRIIEFVTGKWDEPDREARGIKVSAQNAVDELNERFRCSSFGYRYELRNIIKIDNEFLHVEVTKPALLFLSDSRFLGADDEFRAAHEHLKLGEFRDATVDANNAFESTMKTICDIKGWKYSGSASAGDLLNTLKNNGLIPGYVMGSFRQLISTLTSGLPTLRSNTGGHGQGAEPIEVPEYVAAYALHLAGSKIRFLYEALRKSEKA